MEKEYSEVAKRAIEDAAKKLKDQPAGLGGKNPHTIKPPPPLPKYTVVLASVRRRSGLNGRNPHTDAPPPPLPQYIAARAPESRFRLSGNYELRAVADPELSAKVFITGKKGKMVKISKITKPK